MNAEQFDKIVTERLEKIKQTLLVKAKEYARGNDRLHNFNNGAAITGQKRERVLDGFLLKHYISYRDMLDDLDAGKIITDAYIDEKIGDIIVYFILQEASLKERNIPDGVLILPPEKAEQLTNSHLNADHGRPDYGNMIVETKEEAMHVYDDMVTLHFRGSEGYSAYKIGIGAIKRAITDHIKNNPGIVFEAGGSR